MNQKDELEAFEINIQNFLSYYIFGKTKAKLQGIK